MPIPLTCDQCGREYKVKSKLAGQRFRCRDCAYVIHVPTPEVDSSADQTAVDDSFGNESDDDQTVIDELCWAPAPPAAVGLHPASRSTSTTVTMTATEPGEKKKKRKQKIAIPWKFLLSGAVVVAVIVMLAKIALNDPELPTEEPSESTQINTTETKLTENTGPDKPVEPEPGPSEDPQPFPAATDISWRRHQLTGQPFSILMPGIPKPMAQPPAGMPLTGVEVDLADEVGGAFSIMCIENPLPAGEPVDPKQHFDGIKQGMMRKRPRARLTSEQDISITDRSGNVHPGKEYRFEGPVGENDLIFLYRVFQVGPKLVTSFSGLKHENEGRFYAMIEKFQNSLTVIASIPPIETSSETVPDSDNPAPSKN